MKKVDSGGGWQAIQYSWRKAKEVGPIRFWRAMRTKNACKTCALGMGGQLGGMHNEEGRFPEVCKKSMQAMVADMRGKVDKRIFASYTIDEFRKFTSRELEAFGRLSQPVIREQGAPKFRPIGWDEAIQIIVDSLRVAAPERAFFYASGRSSSEAGFLLQLLARQFGTNHVNNCSFYCHQASGVGLKASIGTSTATIDLADLEHCDLVFLIGGNPASNHPRLMTSLMRVRKRGGKVIVINPVRETGLVKYRIPSNLHSLLLGSEIASNYLQPTIGGDIALMAGIAKSLVEADAIDSKFIESHTVGFNELIGLLESIEWSSIEQESGIDRSTITAAAHEYARSESAIFAWTMGITHHDHGVENVRWIVNLALLRGMVGKPGAGLLPIRGHSNVQGMGTVGVTPSMTKLAVEGLSSMGLPIPQFRGFHTLEAIEAAGRGEMDFGLCLGGNLFGASPDSPYSTSALSKLNTLVYLNTTLNTGHFSGLGKLTLILPVLPRDEESQSTTQESMFSYVRLSDGGKARFSGPRSEVDILCDLGERLFPAKEPVDWGSLRKHDNVRHTIANLVEGMKELENIGATKREFHIPGRRLYAPDFPTESGKAAFFSEGPRRRPAFKHGELRLMTVRSEGQFNTVVYEEEDLYRGQERRDVILLNPNDIELLGLLPNQLVNVSNSVGYVRNQIVRPFDIALGCALMYYPESNYLIPRVIDPASKTPAFKSAVVQVEPVKGNNGEPVFAQNPSSIKQGGAEEAGRRSLKAC